jgi:hypothetical protein
LGYGNIKRIFYAAVRDNDYSLIVDTGEGEETDKKYYRK